MWVEWSTTRELRAGEPAARAARAGSDRLQRAHRPDRAARGAGHLLPRAMGRPRRRRPAPKRRPATSAPRRRPRATCASCGRATRSARAGASTPTSAACRSTRRCASASPTSSSTAATPSMPTGRSCAEVKLADGSIWRNIVHRREEQGRRNAERVSRQLPLQPARRERAPLRRRGDADLAVGRPRGHEQLVGEQGPRRPTSATPRRTCRCWSRAAHARSSSTRRCAGTRSRRTSASTASIPYGPLLDVFVIDMRSYRGPNTDNRQAGIDAETRYLGAEQLAWLRAELQAQQGGVEGDRVRHADRPAGHRRQGRARPHALRGGRQRRRPGARPRARDRPAAVASSSASASATWCGSRPTCTTPPRTTTTRAARSSTTSIRSGSSSAGR